jgi:hypothetical protein
MAERKSLMPVLSILAIILGASGLGGAAFSMFTLQTQINNILGESESESESGVVHTWYKESPFEDSTTATGYQLMGEMNLTVQINAGESLYAHFEGMVKVSVEDGVNTLYIKIFIGGFGYFPFTQCYSEDYLPASLQNLETGLTPGEYIVEVRWFKSGSITGYCTHKSLLVQTIIP